MIKDFKFCKKFFETNENLEHDAILQICKTMKYEKVDGDTILFKQGDESNGKLYIIYSGKVSVVLKQDDHILNQNRLVKEEEYKEKNRKFSTLIGTQL